MPSATHDCGLCDGPLVFAGMEGEYATYTCKECEWWHITKDCCEWACCGGPIWGPRDGKHTASVLGGVRGFDSHHPAASQDGCRMSRHHER